MEKLEKVIAGLECCRNGNKCVDACLAMCPYYGEHDGEKVCLDLRQEDALEVLESLKAERDDLNRRIDKYVDALYECGLAMKAMEQENQDLRRELAAGVLRGMPNDYGEYPPEFPREGM